MIEIDNPEREAALEAFGEPVKECRKCHEWLPMDDEFYYRETREKCGYNSWCKACWNDYRDDRRARLAAMHATR